MNELKELFASKSEEVTFDPSVPRSLRRQVLRRRAGVTLAGVAIAIALVVVGVNLTDLDQFGAPEVPPADRTNENVDQFAQSSFTNFEDLPAGEQEAGDFGVPFTFRVTGSGWEVVEYAPDFLALEFWPRPGDLDGAIYFHHVKTVRDPADPETNVPLEGSFVSWIDDHPNLELISSDPYRLGRVTGQRIAFRAIDPYENPACLSERCVLFHEAEGAAEVAQAIVGDGVERMWVFEVNGQTVFTWLDVGIKSFSTRAEDLLKTVRFLVP